MIEHNLVIKSSSADAPHGIVISLIIVIRVPVVQIRVPRILRTIAVRSTRPVISRDEIIVSLVATPKDKIAFLGS